MVIKSFYASYTVFILLKTYETTNRNVVEGNKSFGFSGKLKELIKHRG